MESPNLFVPMLVAILVIIVNLIALPLLVTRLTQPRWALFKSGIEFLAIAVFISALLSFFVGVPIAFAIAMVRHRNRVSRHTASSTTDEAIHSKSRATISRWKTVK